ncbi:MAG: hypothetical protein IJD48_01895 [Clostridia bacterium]|nr:hypothetical protein [Clostridia bacterium]
MKKFICLFMMVISIFCGGMMFGCSTNTESNEAQTKCIVNGIEYDVMIATAQAVDSRYNSTTGSYQTSYDIEIRILITNLNDVEFSSNTKAFKFTASNNNALSGVENSFFGEIKIWRDMENASEFTIPAKCSTTVDLSFSTGIMTEDDGIYVSFSSNGGVYSYRKYSSVYSPELSFYNSCKEFMKVTDFNIYVGSKLIKNIDFIVSNM